MPNLESRIQDGCETFLRRSKSALRDWFWNLLTGRVSDKTGATASQFAAGEGNGDREGNGASRPECFWSAVAKIWSALANTFWSALANAFWSAVAIRHRFGIGSE